jgi:peptidyl-prolyl cis-trans isomerase C
LLTGTRFDALAAISIDSGSNRAGGDLGWVRLSSLDPSLKGVVESLGAGNFTLQPVRTEFGYHVVLVEDVRPIGVPRYEDLRDSITQQLTRELLVGHIADLKDRSKLVY